MRSPWGKRSRGCGEGKAAKLRACGREGGGGGSRALQGRVAGPAEGRSRELQRVARGSQELQ